MSEAQKRRNRNNRHRGSHFEKVVADFLDMDVVPYSGSNARFGYGDVRDSKWLCECKNITAVDGRCKIITEWINDNIRKANGYGLMPFLTWMPAGKSDKFVIIDPDTFIKMGGCGHIQCVEVEIPKKSVVAVNMFIDINGDFIKSVRAGKIARLNFGNLHYYMTNLSQFRSMIDARGLKGVRQNYDK